MRWSSTGLTKPSTAGMSTALVGRLIAVFIYTPYVVPAAMAVGVLGVWIGQVYMKAQLSVKREMSNAKAPVLGIFGAAINGLRKSRDHFEINAQSERHRVRQHLSARTVLKRRSRRRPQLA